MQEKQQEPRKHNSIRTAIIYLLIVGILIIVAIVIRVIFLMFHTSYDGKHQYIVAITRSAKQADIIAFSPDADEANKIRVLQVKGVFRPRNLSRQIGIPIDAQIDYTQGKEIKLKDTMKDIFFRFHLLPVSEQMNVMDAFRLMLFAGGVKEADIIQKTVILPLSEDAQHQLKNFFQDKTIFSEGLSITVINATGRSGIGNSFGKILSHVGANVIAVDTAETERELTTIEYSGFGGWTIQRLEKLLAIKANKVKKTGFSDIIITIGKRSLYLPIF